MLPANLCHTTASAYSPFLAGPPQPLIVTLEGLPAESPLDLYARIASPSQYSFLLESGSSSRGDQARYSIMGSGPTRILSPTQDPGDDPFALFKEEMTVGRLPDHVGLPPFCGGAVGYFSYDFVRRLETLPPGAHDDLAIPDFQFGLFELTVAIDHRDNRVQVIFYPSMKRFLGEDRDMLYREGIDRLAEYEARLRHAAGQDANERPEEAISFFPEQTREDYLNRVRRCQEYIAAGDIYQANLSHRFSFVLPACHRTPSERLRYEQSLYRQLQAVNPSPFSGILRFGDLSLISCSPERLIRLRGRQADTRPIAGTRPRGESADDDRRLVEDLLTNEKERAEHVMLLDLERNDLGRVCEFGSLKVDECMGVEQYSHVSHIVSNISGRLRQDATPFDLIRAVFPGGTITGVPKIRCMEIIDELEPVRRGPYTGSFGYIGWNGDLDLNIIIRTLVTTQSRGYLQVGAGIVADSDPAREYEETLHKARAFFRSFQG